MNDNDLRLELESLRDEKVVKFNSKLISTSYTMLGIRIPDLKKLAKKYAPVLNELAPQNYEEIMLKGFAIGYIKDIDLALDKVEKFLPYIDNWAVCDCVTASLKILGKYPDKALDRFKKLVCSDKVYDRRFIAVLIMNYCLFDGYIDCSLELLTKIVGGDYYVDMAIAWAISVVLIKYWDRGVKLLTERKFNIFTHNKAIQKARESFRISDTQKEYLNTLKVKKS